MTFLFLLYVTFVSVGAIRNLQKEIGHYNIRIKSIEAKGEDVMKTFFLYTNENPSLQAKNFCEENGIHPDGTPYKTPCVLIG